MHSSRTPGVMIQMPNGGHLPVFARNSWQEARFLWKNNLKTNGERNLKMIRFQKESPLSGVHFQVPYGCWTKNRFGAPKSWILIGFSIIKHPFWGTPNFGNTHVNFQGFKMFLFMIIRWSGSVWVVLIGVDSFCLWWHVMTEHSGTYLVFWRGSLKVFRYFKVFFSPSWCIFQKSWVIRAGFFDKKDGETLLKPPRIATEELD